MSKILSNQQRARQAITALKVNLGAIALSICTLFVYAVEITTVTTQDEVLGLTAFVAVGLTIRTVVFIVTIVLFIQWFRRAYANLHRLGVRTLEYREGWAAGAWFVPLLNLWWPFEIAREIWHYTQTEAPGRDPAQPVVSSRLLGWWWALWVSSHFLSGLNMVVNSSDGPQTPETAAQTMFGAGLALLVMLAAGVLAIRVVRQISQFETALFDAQSAVPSDPAEHLVA